MMTGRCLVNNIYTLPIKPSSYTTPQIGFGCRSVTKLLYGLSQSSLQILWLLDWVFWDRNSDRTVKTFGHEKENFSWIDYVWYTFFFLATFLGTFTSIGGTCKTPSEAVNMGQTS